VLRSGGISIFGSRQIPLTIKNNIVAFTIKAEDFPAGYGIYVANESQLIDISCNDIYGNDGGSYYGIPDQTGINGNFSLDPIFCSPDNGIYSIHIMSPCAPGNHPDGGDCGLIGAYGPECDYVATLLCDYTASFKQSAVNLEWSISEERSVEDFAIQRARAPGFDYLPLIRPMIFSDGYSFVFADDDVSKGESYRYQVLIDDDGRSKLLFETATIPAPELPIALRQNTPNPFNPSTEIGYYLPERGDVSIGVYDVTGRLISELAEGVQEAGDHKITWNGQDSCGREVASGVYFYLLRSGKKELTRKMVLLR
jgi:hypothetical protein